MIVGTPAAMPFAAPLVAVDHIGVTETAGGLAIHCTKRVDAGDPYLSAHFPSLTILPGVFVIEAVRQAVALAVGAPDGAPPEITEVRSARFLAPLLQGETMSLEVTVARREEGGLQVDAHCRRGDGVTAARVRLEMQETERP